jgi:hypothetical protein
VACVGDKISNLSTSCAHWQRGSRSRTDHSPDGGRKARRSRPHRYVPDGRGRHSEDIVRRDPAAHRETAAVARSSLGVRPSCLHPSIFGSREALCCLSHRALQPCWNAKATIFRSDAVHPGNIGRFLPNEGRHRVLRPVSSSPVGMVKAQPSAEQLSEPV